MKNFGDLIKIKIKSLLKRINTNKKPEILYIT